MNCEQAQNLLTRHLLGDLDEATSGEIRVHLKECDGCRAAAREIEPTLDLLRDALAAPSKAPERLSGAHRAKIRLAMQGLTRVLGEKRLGRDRKVIRWFTAQHVSLGVAAAVVLICCALAGMLLPAKSSSRERARRVRSMSNLIAFKAETSARRSWGRLRDKGKMAEVQVTEPEAVKELDKIEEIAEVPPQTTESVQMDISKPESEVHWYKHKYGKYAAKPSIPQPGSAGEVPRAEFGPQPAEFYSGATYGAEDASQKPSGESSSVVVAGDDRDLRHAELRNQIVQLQRQQSLPEEEKTQLADESASLEKEVAEIPADMFFRDVGVAPSPPAKPESATRTTRDAAGYTERIRKQLKKGSGTVGGLVVADGKAEEYTAGQIFVKGGKKGGDKSDEVAEKLSETQEPVDMESRSAPDFSPQPAEFDAVAMVESPVIMKGIYGSRSPCMRGSALATYGGSGVTEGTVLRSLRWLKEKQSDDGSWDDNIEDTSVSLLAYLARGETPASQEFGATTEKAIRYLVEEQREDGRFSDDPEENAKAAYALNEVYGLTKIPMVKQAAEKATSTLIADQAHMKDFSGWQASALKSAKISGIEVDGLDNAIKDGVVKLKRSESTGAVLGLQILGHGSDKETREKMKAVHQTEFVVKGREELEDLYFTHQSKFHQGGKIWGDWNKKISPELVKKQVILKGKGAGGKDIGYWGSASGEKGDANTVYNTALASLMNEVYYRYLPTFKPSESIDAEKDISSEDDIDIEIAFEAPEEENLSVEEKVPEEEDLTGPRFKAVGVNPFYSATERPFSTFAIDVDTAAYTLARNYMLKGFLPPAEAVRTEEFVNFFDYAYQPPDRDTFKIYTACAPSKFGHGLHLLKIGVKGKRLGREEKRNAMLTFVIDTSGSMNTLDRIRLVKKSLHMLVERLGPNDRVAIIQFGSHARLVLDYTPASEKEKILAAIDSLQTTGSTNLEEAMKLAYQLAARNFAGGAANRVLVMSDGAANLGAGAAEDILKAVEQYSKQGIFCSIFGFGIGTYNDEMLEKLANKGDGTYTFIDSEEEAKRVFVDDLAATINTIASDVKIQIEFNPLAVKNYRQLGYENRQLTKEQFRDDTVDAGEVGSGQSVTALYELQLKTEDRSQRSEVRGQTSTLETRHSLILATVRVRYRRTDNGAVEEIEKPIRVSDIAASFDETNARFRLAACAAEFAELLRACPYAADGTYEDVAKVLRPVALELNLDKRVSELLRMIQGASGMSRGDFQ